MSRPSVAADAAAREQILTSLARMFPAGTSDNLTAARNAAWQMLAGGSEGMLTEVRLAALTIAFGFGALDSLARSMTPTLTINEVLRLRDNASALHSAAQISQEALDRARCAEQEQTCPRLATECPLPKIAADTVAFASPEAEPPAGMSRLPETAKARGDANPKSRSFTACAMASGERRVVSTAFVAGFQCARGRDAP